MPQKVTFDVNLDTTDVANKISIVEEAQTTLTAALNDLKTALTAVTVTVEPEKEELDAE